MTIQELVTLAVKVLEIFDVPVEIDINDVLGAESVSVKAKEGR